MPVASFAELDVKIKGYSRAGQRPLQLPADFLKEITGNGLLPEEVGRLLGETPNFDSSAPLEPPASETVARIIRVASLADSVFGNHDLALKWLRSPNSRLANLPPLQYLERESDSQLVLDILHRIAYGMVS